MKKVLKNFQNLFVISLLFVCALLSVKFIYSIRHENVDTNYIWNITSGNLVITEGSIDGTINDNNNQIDLTVKMKKEGEFYEFTYDINNEGNLDASLKNIEKNIESKNDILKTSITYANNEEIKVGDVLKSKEKTTIKIRIEYPKQKEKIYDELTLKLSFQINYEPLY